MTYSYSYITALLSAIASDYGFPANGLRLNNQSCSEAWVSGTKENYLEMTYGFLIERVYLVDVLVREITNYVNKLRNYIAATQVIDQNCRTPQYTRRGMAKKDYLIIVTFSA